MRCVFEQMDYGFDYRVAQGVVGRWVLVAMHDGVANGDRVIVGVIAMGNVQVVAGDQRGACLPAPCPLWKSLIAFPQDARTIVQFFYVVMAQKVGKSAFLCNTGSKVGFVAGPHVSSLFDWRRCIGCQAKATVERPVALVGKAQGLFFSCASKAATCASRASNLARVLAKT